MKEDYKFKLLGIDPAVPGGDRSVPPARQEGETKSNTPIMDAAMGWHDRRDLLSQIGMLEMQVSAKQAEVEQEQSNVRVLLFDQETLKTQLHNAKAELESLKAAQGQVLEAFDPNVMKPILIGEFKQQLLTHDEEGEECYQDVFIHWDVIKQIMRAIKEHALPTPPVERSGE